VAVPAARGVRVWCGVSVGLVYRRPATRGGRAAATASTGWARLRAAFEIAVEHEAALVASVGPFGQAWCGFTAPQAEQVLEEEGYWWAAGEVPAVRVPFPAARSPNDAGGFHRTSLSGDCWVRCGVGCPEWMASWQERRTTRVLRRRRACPLGWWASRSGEVCESEVCESLEVVHRDAVRVLAELTVIRREPGDQFRVADAARDGDTVGDDGGLLPSAFCLLSGRPPNRATSGFPPLRWTLASGHLLGPCGVSVVA
jgi:hypothetical protein